jgi:hypothetical protein
MKQRGMKVNDENGIVHTRKQRMTTGQAEKNAVLCDGYVYKQ